MEATDILMSEHRVIERVIAILEIAAENWKTGKPFARNFSWMPPNSSAGLLMAATTPKRKGFFSRQWQNAAFPSRADRLASCWQTMSRDASLHGE